jgi:HEAT repeat protein
LLALFADPDEQTRAFAAQAVGRLATEDDRALARLEAVLRHPKSAVRGAAVSALRQTGCRSFARARQLLLSALDDGQPAVRTSVPYALASCYRWGERQGREAMHDLLPLLEHHDPDVVQAAVDALQNVTSKQYGADPAKWQAWWTAEEEQAAAEKRRSLAIWTVAVGAAVLAVSLLLVAWRRRASARGPSAETPEVPEARRQSS